MSDVTQDLRRSSPASSVADSPPAGGGLSIRAVLVIGFGLTVGIWLFAWSYFNTKMHELELQSQEVSGRYMAAQDKISVARSDVYRASILVRDALLSPDAPTADDRTELDLAYSIADESLRSYEPVQPREGVERIRRLREEIGALRLQMTELIDADNAAWLAADRRALLDRMRPRRDAAIRVAQELQSINRAEFIRHQESTSELYRDTQQQFSQSLGLALIASLGIALFAGLQVGRLEDRVRVQRVKDLQNQQNLQRLSAKLITAQEEERRSIARELHDEVGQVLTAIKVELAVAQHALAASGGQVTVLEDARLITDRALHTVRDLSRLLHPSLLDDIGLPAALDWYLKGYRKRHGIAVKYEVSGMDARLAPEIEVGVYRITQEALTNVVRHAQTNACTLRLVREGGVLRVQVADEGVGFDSSGAGRAPAEQGLGLIGIRERVSNLGGSFRLTSQPGRGTAIEIVLPTRLRAEVDQDEAADGGESADLEHVS
jgi:signal transduction histidine kinase